MGGQEGDFGRRKGEPGKAVQAGKRGKELKYEIGISQLNDVCRQCQ